MAHQTKVFRLYKEGKELKDWEEIEQAYGSDQINGIISNDGDQAIKAPTSIPSPFSRIDLLTGAFQYVVNSGDLDGDTIYHRLVSDCLDVAEILFNRDKYGSKIQIKRWDKQRDLQRLLQSTNPKHQLLGETLELFLNQDADSNNFDALNSMFVLYYNHKIVGGTSPTTLFFTSGNDLSFAQLENGEDTFFDHDLRPLYRRADAEFIKYIYLLFKAHPSALGERMSYFRNYLNISLERLDTYNNPLYNQINEWNEFSAAELKNQVRDHYDSLDIGNPNDYVEVLGCPLKKRKTGAIGQRIQEESQFTISSSKYLNRTGNAEERDQRYTPLVLQNKFSVPLVYTYSGVDWSRNIEIPFFDSRPLDERTIPGPEDRYPYLTVSDFLQPQIIQVPYPLNSRNYFDGHLTVDESGDGNSHFLLPIKPEFFEFFDSADLLKTMPDGKPMFEMKKFAGSVDVTLRIPIKGNERINYVTFERSYESKVINSMMVADPSKNKGVIYKHSFSLLIFPFYQMETHENAVYRVMGLDTNKEGVDTSFEFYRNNNSEGLVYDKTNRSKKKNEAIQTDFYVLKNEFDFIEVNANGNKGIVIPKFKQANGSSAFTFAVDFGTTNTHVEFTKDDSNPQALEITKEDYQYALLHSTSKRVIEEASIFADVADMNIYIRHEFFPKTISAETDFSFPIRTATGEDETLSFTTTPHALADINIPFDYQHHAANRGTRINTGLKWTDFQGDENEASHRVYKYLEQLILMMRSKVLLGRGDLRKTKLVWFFPSSMSSVKIEKLEEVWNELFKAYFHDLSKPIKISESLAPFYFYKARRNIAAANRPVVSIDIGGGTTDFVIFQNDKPTALSSIRFAANSVFGDGYGGNPNMNGFICKHNQAIDELLKTNELRELIKAKDQIFKKGSEDIIAFLFSLEKNKTIVEKRIPISLSKRLADDNELKIVFVTFFVSIIYHVAKVMHLKKLAPPENIVFTGMGSKIITLTSGSSNLTKLEQLTKLVFEKIYQQEIDESISINQEENPKVVTCKGGTFATEETVDINQIKMVLLGDKKDTLIPESRMTYDQFDAEGNVDEVVDEVSDFVALLFDFNKEFNFQDNFGIKAAQLENYKAILSSKDQIKKNLLRGLQRKKTELDGNTAIDFEESLFFYPLIGALNELAYKAVTPKK